MGEHDTPLTPSSISSQDDLVERLLASLDCTVDHPVQGSVSGSHLCMVTSRATGLASLLPGTDAKNFRKSLPGEGESCLALAKRLLAAQGSPAAALSLAALNSLLPLPEHVSSLKGQEVIRSHGQGRRVVVVGHFPFVDRMQGDFASFHVVERKPRAGDVAENQAWDILAQAQLAAITSTTMSNGSLGGILDHLSPDCFVMLLGPSTPLAPVLFDHGIHALAGCLVRDAAQVARGVAQGIPFRFLQGVESVLLVRA